MELFGTMSAARARAVVLMKHDIQERGIFDAGLYLSLGAPPNFDFDTLDTAIRRLSLNEAAALYRMLDTDPRTIFDELRLPEGSQATHSQRELSDVTFDGASNEPYY